MTHERGPEGGGRCCEKSGAKRTYFELANHSDMCLIGDASGSLHCEGKGAKVTPIAESVHFERFLVGQNRIFTGNAIACANAGQPAMGNQRGAY